MSKATVEHIESQALTIAGEFNDPELRNKKGYNLIKPSDDFPKVIKEVSEKNLDSLIENLHVMADSRLGIQRYQKKDGISILGHDSNENEEILIRDATQIPPLDKQKFQKLDQTPEAYMISIVSTTRGALKMVDMAENLPLEAKAKLKATLLNTMKEKLSEDKFNNDKVVDKKSPLIKVIRDYENTLVAQLANNNLKIGGKQISDKETATKVLADVRDFCNLQESQPHIATIWNGANKDKITTISARAAPFSDEQIEELKKIKEFAGTYQKPKYNFLDSLRGKPKPPKESEEIKNLPQWYKELKPHQQSLILENADALIKGDKTISTSLRFMPGLRNSYLEIDLKTNEAGKTEQFNKALRIGTAAYYKGKSQKTMKAVTEANLKHLKGLAGNNKHVALQIFNFKFLDEKIICDLTKAGTANTGITYSNVGMQTYYNKEAMVNDIIAGQENVSKGAVQALSCKSAKDRTGTVATFRKLLKYTNNLSMNQKAEVALSNARSAHNETIAGSYGANHGSLGIKTSAMLKFFATLNVGSQSYGKYSWLANDDVQSILKNRLATLNALKPEALPDTLEPRGKATETIFAPSILATKASPDLPEHIHVSPISQHAIKSHSQIRKAAISTSQKSMKTRSGSSESIESIENPMRNAVIKVAAQASNRSSRR